MIKSLEIKNFQCFESVSLSDLTRVNIITGANASGKSALLEALYLGARATGDAVLILNQTRYWMPGINIFAPNPLAGVVGTQLEPRLFFDHFFRSVWIDGSLVQMPHIDIKYEDDDDISYSLSIRYQTSGGEPAPVAVGGLTSPSTALPVVFERRRTLGNQHDKDTHATPESMDLVITTAMGQLQHRPTSHLGPPVFIFNSVVATSEQNIIFAFSQLREKGEHKQVIDFIQSEFPFIMNLEVLAPQGIAGVYGVLSDGTTRRLSFLSAGIYKIVSILLTVANTRNGSILVDEIENGIFYEKYPALWRIIHRFAELTNNQFFVTSHSDECLRALPDVINGEPEAFSLLRAERANGQCVIRHISGTSMKAALSRQGEVRGATRATKTPTDR